MPNINCVFKGVDKSGLMANAYKVIDALPYYKIVVDII